MIDGSIFLGDWYGCIDNRIIEQISFDRLAGVPYECLFMPFRIIPYSHKEPATEFSFYYDDVFLKCSLRNVLAKFLDNATYIELPWLSKSYVKLTVLNRTLYFKWRRSVPELQGTIITINLNCLQSVSYYIIPACLRAKVLGTWSAGYLDAESTVITTPEPKTTAMECSDLERNVFISLFSISLAVNVGLGIWFLCKKMKSNQETNSGDTPDGYDFVDYGRNIRN